MAEPCHSADVLSPVWAKIKGSDPLISSSPAVTVGHTYIVPPERATILDTSVNTVINALSQWGVGAQKIYPPDARQ